MEEDLLGGDSCKNLQSYAYILELKIEMLQQYVKDMAEIQVPLLREIFRYENFVKHMLRAFGLESTNTTIMEEEHVLNQWDAYEAQHLGPSAQFDVALMGRYTYLITQCQQVVKTVGELEKGKKHAKEVLRKYKFRIKHLADPPIQEVTCNMDNYRAFIKK